ncbi:NAD(P)-dependent oxidoreductase [Gloeocapsopsis sp. IPPAS B-1203]|uniref:NAD(P)-dependent oxidoreductase n=1 Tax=Gloeocapsopsis sp. IPPAS B-1203 TaxID=2049454 RepID=UPI000C195AA2|nr:NAD(P)-dependent oxidoreductase [Gloeocapsopsis sp. IPPAS B-1203]PIG93787.1 lactate dehydrogenase [Gloeocapsopsis sp. IPPAS B-1203]
MSDRIHESENLPGRVVVTSSDDLAQRIADHFSPGTVITLPHDRVVLDAPDTFVLVPGIQPVDAALMGRLPQLRLVQRSGVGVENVDIAAATQRGIYIANVPSPGTGNAESVAELVILHMLALARNYRGSELDWNQPEGQSLWKKRVGIYGLGGIGQAIARRLRAFEVQLLGIKRQLDPQLAHTLGLEWLGTPKERSHLLQHSDFVIIAASADNVTQPFGWEDFQQMKSNAYLINVTRGAWIDENALVKALQNKVIAGAGLDVFQQEPLAPDSPLLQANLNLTLTPHLGGHTDTAATGIAKAVVANILRVAQGQPPENCLNVEVQG